MTYINPIELLEIDDISAKTIKKAKTRKLAEIELSDEGGLKYGDRIIDRSEFLKVLEELNDEKKANYHAFIMDQPLLLRFLKWGDITFFEHPTADPLYSSRPFHNFVGAYFAEAFKKAFAEAYQNGDTYILLKMTERPMPILPTHRDTLYRKVEQSLTYLVDDLKLYYNKIKFSPQHSRPTDPSAILEKGLEGWNPNVLNALPKFFEDKRSDLAKTLADMAIMVFDRYPKDKGNFFHLIEAAYQLKVRPSTKQQVQVDYRYLRSKLKDRNAEETEQLKAEVQAMIERLSNIRKGNVGSNSTAQGVLNLIRSIVKLGTLNQAVFELNTLKNQLASELAQLALFVWEKYEDIHAYEEVINIALEIELDSAQTNTLKALKNRQQKKKKKAAYNFGVLLVALSSIRENIQKNIRKEDGLHEPAKIVQLLSDFFRPDLCEALIKEDNALVRKQVFENLLPILHYIRRRDPLAALRLLEQLEDVIKSDKEFHATIEKMGDQILEELKNPSKKKAKKKIYQPAPKRHSLERVGIKERLQDAWTNVVYFFMDTTAGPTRIVNLGMIFSLIFFVVMSFQAVNTMLKAPAKVELAAAPPAYVFVDETEKIIDELKERAKEFKGKQLKTGAMPFEDCFGPGIFDYSTGNSITVSNTSEYDAVVSLKMRDTIAIIRHAYLRKGESVTLSHVPAGKHVLKFYVGNDWASIKPNACNLHGAFYTDAHYRSMSYKKQPMDFTRASHYNINLEDERYWEGRTFYAISARNFFSSKYYLKDHSVTKELKRVEQKEKK
jgi:hypothetical protein